MNNRRIQYICFDTDQLALRYIGLSRACHGPSSRTKAKHVPVENEYDVLGVRSTPVLQVRYLYLPWGDPKEDALQAEPLDCFADRWA